MTSSITRRRVLQTGVAAAALAGMPQFAWAAGPVVKLRIMETTDLHVHVFPYDYYADKPNDTMGLARTASIIDRIRAEATNSMLIDNGDFLQGNPMGDYIAYERGMKDGDVHPVIKAMNTLGYDCSTMGNHEFNYGLDFLFKVLAGANFPFVCANLTKGQLAEAHGISGGLLTRRIKAAGIYDYPELLNALQPLLVGLSVRAAADLIDALSQGDDDKKRILARAQQLADAGIALPPADNIRDQRREAARLADQLVRQILKREGPRQRFDAAWLNLPLLGRLSRGYNAARFSGTLAMLAGAGVPILKALQAAAETLSNRAMQADALDALVQVREGAPLGSALAGKKRFPGILAMFARLGEQTGQLPEMLDRAARQLSTEVQRRAMTAATLLEPLLIVAMGAIVLLIVLAVLLPIIQLNTWVK